MVKHWTEKLFLEHGELFLKVAKRADGRALKEVEFLERIDLRISIGAIIY